MKDSVSKPSANHPYSYVAPGEGEFPAAPLMKLLRDEFAGPVCLEWDKLWHAYLTPLDGALATANAKKWW